jgi:Holliday junction resolvasome RuvABC endonuclease subunit
MFHLADDPTPYRIIGIDPGTDTLGMSCLDLDLLTGQLSIVDSHTVPVGRLVQRYRHLEEVYGSRFARLHGLELVLGEYFTRMQPHSIISESPYLGRFAATYAALTECMTAIKRSVWRYSNRLPLLTIDPASAKANLGVNGKSSDKELMRQAVLKLVDIQNPNNLALEQLDEHSIDSIAIAYYRATSIKAYLRP